MLVSPLSHRNEKGMGEALLHYYISVTVITQQPNVPRLRQATLLSISYLHKVGHPMITPSRTLYDKIDISKAKDKNRADF